MPKIFIINKGCHDYSAAETFGDLTYLSTSFYNKFSTGKMYRTFVDKLKESTPEDYILISGLTIMSSIACAVFAVKHKRLNLLIYKSNGKDKEVYIKRTIVMEDL